MKKRTLFMVFSALSIWVFSAALVMAGWQDVLGTSDSVSESEIVEGLKQALEIGTGKAVDLVSKTGGYYNNPEIKIPLPASVQNAEKLLRGVGFGLKVDGFELSMNNAAERAASGNFRTDCRNVHG